MTHTLIKDLSLGNRGCKLQCRLARIWDCINPRQHNQLISVDFLLIDKQGTSIQGTINHREGSWLKDMVKEGNIYLWTGFIVIPPKQLYRVCPTANFISVSKLTTKIEKISGDIMTTFPSNSFNFVDYETIFARQDDNSFLSDVIGELTSMGSIDEIIVNNNAVKKRNLQLKNAEGITILTTLWNDVAYQLDDARAKQLSDQGCVVIIIVAIAVTRQGGTKQQIRHKSLPKSTYSRNCFLPTAESYGFLFREGGLLGYSKEKTKKSITFYGPNQRLLNPEQT